VRHAHGSADGLCLPEAYDRIVVVKGPQTVLNGPGSSAASVSFERDVPPLR